MLLLITITIIIIIIIIISIAGGCGSASTLTHARTLRRVRTAVKDNHLHAIHIRRTIKFGGGRQLVCSRVRLLFGENALAAGVHGTVGKEKDVVVFMVSQDKAILLGEEPMQICFLEDEKRRKENGVIWTYRLFPRSMWI